MYTPSDVILYIKAKDPAILKWLYDNHRNTFVSWSQRSFSISEEEAVDTFQESVIVLYQNVVEGKLTELNCSVKTYLFSVGKNILLKKYRTKIPTENIQDANFDVATDVKVLEQIELDHRQELLARALKVLGGKCQRLLEYAFYREYTTESIAEELGYSNVNVVKTSKMRCLKQLRTIFFEKFSEQL